MNAEGAVGEGEGAHRVTAPSASDCASAAAAARRLFAERRLRDRAFGADLFGEPAWDMLLILFAAGEQGLHYSVSDICGETPAPVTTAHRWMLALLGRRLLVRVDDPRDGRRSRIYLSESARQRMISFLATR